MKARIRDLAWTREGESLLTITTREDLTSIYDQLHDSEIDVQIKKYRQRRSLDANAYYWLLCGKLAQEIGVSPEEIYRSHIKDIGNFEGLSIKSEAVDSFTDCWCSGHLGRFCETKASKFKGYSVVLAYYGSSDFDRRQMCRLIDNCIQDCEAAGIPTLSDAEIDKMKEAWR